MVRIVQMADTHLGYRARRGTINKWAIENYSRPYEQEIYDTFLKVMEDVSRIKNLDFLVPASISIICLTLAGKSFKTSFFRRLTIHVERNLYCSSPELEAPEASQPKEPKLASQNLLSNLLWYIPIPRLPMTV